MRWLWLGLGYLVLTCAGSGPQRVAHATIPALAGPSEVHTFGSASNRQDINARAVRPVGGHLRRFFDALQGLSTGQRASHVRVLWLGDSHTNADFLTGTVRAQLGQRFGDGGPGFVRVGTKPYRHDRVNVSREGSWNVDPDPPARRSRQGDGVFGLGGTRAEPGPGATFSAQAGSQEGEGQALSSFDLAYVLDPSASFLVELGGRRLRVDGTSRAEVAASGIRHLTLSAPRGSRLVLTPERGLVRWFGLVIESAETRGVVVDTVGIDGARFETALAWDEAAFVAEVARRDPELFVIAYGTNEVFDALLVDRYGPQLAALVERVRKGAPQASCLVLGPTDAPLGDGSPARVAQVSAVLQARAAQLGCGFVSLQGLMGGEGSFAKGMKAKPRLAQPDRLHLTPTGYRELGLALAKLVLDAYSGGRADLP